MADPTERIWERYLTDKLITETYPVEAKRDGVDLDKWRNQLAEIYYLDCVRVAASIHRKSEYKLDDVEEWQGEALLYMVKSIIPAYTGEVKFSTFLIFCLRRRYRQMTDKKQGEFDRKSLKLIEDSILAPPTAACTEILEMANKVLGKDFVADRLRGKGIKEICKEQRKSYPLFRQLLSAAKAALL